jgi:NAD(P)H-dependent FMN reductase
VRVLLISGSLRAHSTNSAVLRTAAVLAPAVSVVADCYEGLASLPAFDPDADVEPRPAPVRELLRRIHLADAVVFCTPEYAGALPGSFKNLLDWLIGDDDARSIYNKPVAWINASPRGAVLAHDSLRAVLGYAHAAIVDAACARSNVRYSASPPTSPWAMQAAARPSEASADPGERDDHAVRAVVPAHRRIGGDVVHEPERGPVVGDEWLCDDWTQH